MCAFDNPDDQCVKGEKLYRKVQDWFSTIYHPFRYKTINLSFLLKLNPKRTILEHILVILSYRFYQIHRFKWLLSNRFYRA